MNKFGIDWHVAVCIISWSISAWTEAWINHNIDFLVHALCEYEIFPQKTRVLNTNKPLHSTGVFGNLAILNWALIYSFK